MRILADNPQLAGASPSEPPPEGDEADQSNQGAASRDGNDP